MMIIGMIGCGRLPMQNTHDHKKVLQESKELDFTVFNDTNETQYIACFYWGSQTDIIYWHWYKTDTYEIKPKSSARIQLPFIRIKRDRDDTYGFLGVFRNKIDADLATWTSVPDNAKIALGKLSRLKSFSDGKLSEKQVRLIAERYGYMGTVIDFRIEDLTQESKKQDYQPELDFWVENQTGEPIFITCFVFDHHIDHQTWVFEATSIQFMKPNDIKMIDVNSLKDQYDWENVRGYLAIFRTPTAEARDTDSSDARAAFEHMQKAVKEELASIKLRANLATYELTEARERLYLDVLNKIRGKKIVLIKRETGLEIDRLGIEHTSMIEYRIENFTEQDAQKVSAAHNIEQ